MDTVRANKSDRGGLSCPVADLEEQGACSVLPVVSRSNMLDGAVSGARGLLALPQGGTAVRLYHLPRQDETSQSRGGLSVTSFTLQAPCTTPEKEDYVFALCWGPQGICPEMLAVAYPTRWVLWAVNERLGSVDLSCTYCSSVPLARPPRKIVWHPSSPLCLLTVCDASEVTMYSAASPSAPSLLYRIQPQGKPALSACAWHSGGTALVLAAGAELRLVVWSKEDKDLSEGPDGESTWLPDREEQHEGGGLAAHRGLGRMRGLLGVSSSSCCCCFLVGHEAPLRLSQQQQQQGGGLGGGPPALLNSTLEELRVSRRRTVVKGGALLAEVEEGEEVQTLEARSGGVLELGAHRGGQAGGVSASLGPLASLLNMTQLQQDQQAANCAVEGARLLGVKVVGPGPARLSEAQGGSCPLPGLPVPSLLAYMPHTPDSEHDSGGLVAVAGEASGVIVCLDMAAGAAGTGGRPGLLQETCRFELPAGWRPRGLAFLAQQPETLLCYAAKRAAAAASSSTPEPLPGLPSLAATANFNTKLFAFSLPQRPRPVPPPPVQPPSVTVTMGGHDGMGSRLESHVVQVLERLVSGLRVELMGRLDGIEEAVRDNGRRLQQLEQRLGAASKS